MMKYKIIFYTSSSGVCRVCIRHEDKVYYITTDNYILTEDFGYSRKESFSSFRQAMSIIRSKFKSIKLLINKNDKRVYSTCTENELCNIFKFMTQEIWEKQKTIERKIYRY